MVILVLPTSLKPSSAALPVSPLVALKMTMSLSSFELEVNIYGKSCKATSLNAEVGPWNSSRK